jgi:hypothetical protein
MGTGSQVVLNVVFGVFTWNGHNQDKTPRGLRLLWQITRRTMVQVIQAIQVQVPTRELGTQRLDKMTCEGGRTDGHWIGL